MKRCLISLPTKVITLYDIVSDSPAWRANAILMEEQIDQYEKWIDCFTKSLKSYLDNIAKSQILAMSLCKASFLSAADDSNMAYKVVNNFAETFQSTLVYKNNFTSTMEDVLFNPLQKLVKQDLKDFKESKKQFERLLDKYENHLSRYFSQSKQKEASALREDAFQMHELKKLYVKQSGEYFIKLASIKSKIEQIIVHSFTNAINAFVDDIEDTQRAFSFIKMKLSGWMRWLEESKTASNYQLNIIAKEFCQISESHLQQSIPHRSLKRYSISQEVPPAPKAFTITEKHGYLNLRTSKSVWTRRWFFIKNGWIGILAAQKQSGHIVMSDRLLISECSLKSGEGDRRFYFEIVHHKSVLCLQAETDEDLKEWTEALEYKQNILCTAQRKECWPKSPLYPSELMSRSNDGFYSFSDILSYQNTFHSLTVSLLTGTMLENAENPSHAIDAKPDTNNNGSGSILSWGIPWSYVPEDGLLEQQSNAEAVWPTKYKNTVTPDIKNYSLTLKHQELRQLFDCVPKDEVVLDVMKVSLYNSTSENKKVGYSGAFYITQSYVRFYSCTLMTHLQMCMIPLEKIHTVKVENTLDGARVLLNGLVFGLLSILSAEKMAEKLKVVSSQKTTDLQSLHDILKEISTPKARNHVTSSSTLHPFVTPLTIQVQQPSPLTTKNSIELKQKNVNDKYTGEHDSAAHTALKAAYESVQLRTSKKQGMDKTPNSSSSEDEENSSIVFEQQSCDCEDHLEKKEVEIELNISAKKLFDTLFSNSQIWSELNKIKGFGEPKISEWGESEKQGEKKRTLTYMMPVFNPMVKAKQTEVIETQQVLVKRDQLSYVVLVTTKTPDLPYSDSFLPAIKYCITGISSRKSKLLCSVGVQWLKSVNMFSKKIIKNESLKGMSETINTLISTIKKRSTQKISSDIDKTSESLTKTLTLNNVPKSALKAKSWKWLIFSNLGLIVLFFLLTIYQFRIQKKCFSFLQNPISWKGIYLEEMNNITEYKTALNRHVDPAVLKLFQNDRSDLLTWSHTWNSRHHKLIAFDLGYSKEKIGTLRYEVLSIVRILNTLEAYIFEKEFYNWVEDKNLNCDKDMCNLYLTELSHQ
ncbi:hypothetical protein BY458DRAFT_462474 [Sporodiniella umbellata]|nr:hypothetical protein BY458DRAFT_462474 [Sporodiniella umbellata]